MADAGDAPRGDAPSTPIQIHLIDLPQMLEDIVRAALGSEAVTFADGLPGPSSHDAPTLVIARHDHRPEAERWMPLWRRRPDVTVLVIEPRQGDGVLFEVWPRRRMLGTLTEERIVAAARAVSPWDQRLLDDHGQVGA